MVEARQDHQQVNNGLLTGRAQREGAQHRAFLVFQLAQVLGWTPEDALPDKWEPFVKINYAYPEGAGAVNALVTQYADEHNVQNSPPDA